jgi:hypothetical protein
VLARLSPDGHVQSIDQQDGNGLVNFPHVALAGGSVYASISGALLRYDSMGAFQESMAVPGMERLVGNGTGLLGSGLDIGDRFVTFRDDSGKEVWSATGAGEVAGLDRAGRSYATFVSPNGSRSLVRFDTDGHPTLTASLPLVLSDTLTSMAIDASGNAYLAGFEQGGSSGPSSALLMRVSATGHVSWKILFGATGASLIHAVDVDAAGHVWVGGEWIASDTGAQASVGEFDSSGNLLQQFLVTRAGPAEVQGLAVGGDGSIYIAGNTSAFRTDGGASDMYVAKLVTTPEPLTAGWLGLGGATLLLGRRRAR